MKLKAVEEGGGCSEEIPTFVTPSMPLLFAYVKEKSNQSLKQIATSTHIHCLVIYCKIVYNALIY